MTKQRHKYLIISVLLLALFMGSACSKQTALGPVNYDASLALLSYEAVEEGIVGVVYRQINNLTAFLATSKEPVLLAFYDPSDQANVLFIPQLEQMAVDHQGQLQLVLVNTRREEEISDSFTVLQLPQFTLVVDAVIKKTLLGYDQQGSTRLEELIKPYLS